MVIVAHNLSSMNIQRQFGINTKNDKKVTEKLASGYKINRAADDAAGLVISEKMRLMIRGLNQGTDNAQDGISWVQIGDGALDEVHDMLHRMTELSVESLNGVYTADDRAAMEAEFSALQCQIDDITQNAKFNDQHIFSEHEPTFYKVEGNIIWPHDTVHDVYSPENTLEVTYRVNKNDPPLSVTLTIPEGSYTTRELADELDDAIAKSPLGYDPRLYFEYTERGSFNANLEGGARIESLSGGLSSLLNKTYQGGSTGALIGTTVFSSEGARLRITSGKNDNMNFVIEDFSGNKTTKTLTLAPGSYTRDQLVDLLNNELSGTDVTAKKYGTGIMLSGDDCIISQFKGNMFQIDGAQYTSVFYDNVFHGEVSLTAGEFTGGTVLPTESYSSGRDLEHRSFEIVAGENDQLTFQPNGADTPTTITIPAGRYLIGNMINELNSQFSSNGLALKATSVVSGNFAGIKITSQVKGATSDVGISSSSSAYDTLFVERKYNSYSTQTVITNEGTPDRTAYFLGGKSFTNTSYNNLPLSVTAGQNDAFSLQIGNRSYGITVAAGTYTTADAVCAAVNTALLGADLGANTGQVSAVLSGGKIRLNADSTSDIVTLKAAAVSGNNGFADIFTTSYKLSERIIGGTSATLDRVFPDPTSISESEKRIRVESTDGSASYYLELPTGDSVTHQQIIDKIESTPGASTFTDITYTESSGRGTNNNFPASGRGQTSSPTVSYSNTGVTEGGGIEGQVGGNYTTNTPAKITVALKNSFTPSVGSDQLRLTINGQAATFTFDHIAYTPTTFATALQQKINDLFGTGYGSAEVKASGNNITITARLLDEYGMEMRGDETSLACSSETSSLLRELNTTRYPGVLTTPSDHLLPRSGINVSDGDTFEFSLSGVRKTVNLTALSNASGSAFAAMLDNCLAAQGIPVTATAVPSGNGYLLRLTTLNAGEGNDLNYNSATGGTVSSKLFGDLTTSGYTQANTPVQQNITIENEKTAFRYTVDGVVKTAHLTPGTYTRSDLLTELDSKLEGVSVSLDSNGILKLTSDSKGTSSTVSMPYDSRSDSAMRAIWGQRENKAPALTASFDSTNHLVLTSQDGTEFRIRSSQSAFVEQTRTPTYQRPTNETGYHSTVHATMDGGDLVISASNPLVINEWNDNLTFNYFKNTTPNPVSVTVTHGTYTSYDQLRENLQSKLDNAVGSGELTVSVDEHGVVIRAEESGYARYIGVAGYSTRRTSPPTFGDFYDKVMNRATEQTQRLQPTTTYGSNVAGTNKLPYVIGRRNVKDKPVTIKEDINDTLSIDFTYPDDAGRTQNKTFTMKLAPGTYQGNSLSHMIQDKLNEQLRSAGFANNLIEVGIGGTNAVVAGVDNDKVLTFKLSNSLPLPSSGEYVIDGIGGSAAFSVFYQTTGELVPAYIEGVKDLTKGVVIEEDHNELSFTTDGNTYSVEIPAGKYTGSEMISQLNTLLEEQSAPVKAEMTDDGTLKLSHKQMGNHPITNLSGSARGGLFFNEYGAIDEDRSIALQFSSVLDDNKTLDRPVVTTAFLGINSVTITKPKYAGKANDRLQGALNRVSEVRSYFGASQNAIEHVVNRNNNTAENLQDAESRIRDTDMAKSMLEHATHQILIQTGQALLSQANQNNSSVLQLLG